MPANAISPPGLARTDGDALWEFYHENSKTGQYEKPLPVSYVASRMKDMADSLRYDRYPAVKLPVVLTPLLRPMEEVLYSRVTARKLEQSEISLETLATLLHGSYGLTRDNEGTLMPRPFRVVPSAGALYPLELYFHTVSTSSLDSGLYHYSPARNSVEMVRPGDGSRFISEGLVQRELPFQSSVLVFITSLFDRATFKYGERGYRFALLEAGHVAQNLALVASALGMGVMTIGGYYDRIVDRFLEVDGVEQSTVYIIAIGGNGDTDTGTTSPDM
jgi:SagB-type dehydrogenase family enzyme